MIVHYGLALLLGISATAAAAEMDAPPWLDGYRVRFKLRVVGDPESQRARTVIAPIPTGGWAGPDAADLVVQGPDGQVLPSTVLSHAPNGQTTVQFSRQGNAAVYWAYTMLAPGAKPPTPTAVTQVRAAERAVAAAQAEVNAAQKTLEQTQAAQKAGQERVAEVEKALAKAGQDVAEIQKKIAAPSATVAADPAVLAQLKLDLAQAADRQLRAKEDLDKRKVEALALGDAVAKANLALKAATAKLTAAQAAHQQQLVAADPRLAREGVTLEVRRWEGQRFDDWPTTRQGLVDSKRVLGSAVVGEIIQYANPLRQGLPSNLATSYRGTLKIDKTDVYRFFLNSDDAAFLFIDDQLVYGHGGPRRKLTGRVSLTAHGALIKLEAGLHSVEVHHVMGPNAQGQGYCYFLWINPTRGGWQVVPRENFVQSLIADTVGIEEVSRRQAAAFVAGVEEVIVAEGLTLMAVRYQAVGHITDPRSLRWDLGPPGSGDTATGATVTRVYFDEGDYPVKLFSGGDLPAFEQTVHVWAEPTATGPLSLTRAVDLLSQVDIRRQPVERLSAMFHFLVISQQPRRWPVLERVARQLLAQKGLDPEYRVQLYSAVMHALAAAGKADQAHKLGEQAIREISGIASLRGQLLLTLARIEHQQVRDFEKAAALYHRVLDELGRMNDPVVRESAIGLGDLLAEAGDLNRARQAYILAAGVGAAEMQTTAAADAVQRGAMLRVVEQKIGSGDIRQAQKMLEQIEQRQPEQKLESLYTYLRAQVDRLAGRYDQAMKGYQRLLNEAQAPGSGFSKEAMLGLAMCHFRLDELDKAEHWLETLKQSYVVYYTDKGGAALEKLLVARRERTASAGGKDAELFTGLAFDFEADEKPPDMRTLPAGDGLGISGPRVAWGALLPASRYLDLGQQIRNLTPGGYYWVQWWWRDLGNRPFTGENPHTIAILYGDATVGHAYNQAAVYLDRTYGRWRKAGALLRMPQSLDGRLLLTTRLGLGLIQLDGVRVEPVSDEQVDAFERFKEGERGR